MECRERVREAGGRERERERDEIMAEVLVDFKQSYLSSGRCYDRIYYTAVLTI